MYGLGNLFSGLGSLMTLPNMLSAMDFISKGIGTYGQIENLLNPPKMPDFPRLDMQGNQGQPVPDPGSAYAGMYDSAAPDSGGAGADPASQAMAFASARKALASRGIYEGGAAANPMGSFPGLFGGTQSANANPGQGQALGFANGYPGQEEEENPYGGFV